VKKPFPKLKSISESNYVLIEFSEFMKETVLSDSNLKIDIKSIDCSITYDFNVTYAWLNSK
jgi:hypothetical protein